jgi:hypothetical protein
LSELGWLLAVVAVCVVMGGLFVAMPRFRTWVGDHAGILALSLVVVFAVGGLKEERDLASSDSRHNREAIRRLQQEGRERRHAVRATLLADCATANGDRKILRGLVVISVAGITPAVYAQLSDRQKKSVDLFRQAVRQLHPVDCEKQAASEVLTP